MPAKINRNRIMMQEEEEDGDEYISDHPDHKKHMELINKRMRKNKIINEHLRARGTKPQGNDLCTRDIKVREPKILRSMMRNILKKARNDPELKKMSPS